MTCPNLLLLQCIELWSLCNDLMACHTSCFCNAQFGKGLQHYVMTLMACHSRLLHACFTLSEGNEENLKEGKFTDGLMRLQQRFIYTHYQHCRISTIIRVFAQGSKILHYINQGKHCKNSLITLEENQYKSLLS